MITGVEVAVVGIVGTIVGLLVGKLWDRGDEKARWIRDESARAYVDYVNSFVELRQILRRLCTLDRADPDWEAARSRRKDAWVPYNSALSRTELYGSPSVYAACLAVDEELRRVSVLASAGGPVTVDQWHVERRRMDSLMRECIDGIRQELKLKKHQNRGFWVEASPSASEPARGGDGGERRR